MGRPATIVPTARAEALPCLVGLQLARPHPWWLTFTSRGWLEPCLCGAGLGSRFILPTEQSSDRLLPAANCLLTQQRPDGSAPLLGNSYQKHQSRV